MSYIVVTRNPVTQRIEPLMETVYRSKFDIEQVREFPDYAEAEIAGTHTEELQGRPFQVLHVI